LKIDHGRRPIRSPLLIHAAGRKASAEELAAIAREFGVTLNAEEFDYGAIIGCAELVDIVTRSPSPWFCGPYGFVLDRVRPIDPIPFAGRLRLFVVNRETRW